MKELFARPNKNVGSYKRVFTVFVMLERCYVELIYCFDHF